MAKVLRDEAASAMAMCQPTIGIIDDDPSILKAIRRLLTIGGYRVETFGSAEEFLSHAAMSNAACLLVDCELGGRSGVDLSRELVGAGFRFPTIFMSGSDSEALRDQAAELGCVAFLRKPFAERELREFIAKAIASSPVRKG